VRRIAIASGKGGVGKSTVTVALAVALRETGASVGILDADLYGPNIPRILGLTRTADAPHVELTGRRRLRPVERDGLLVMSSQFLVGEGQPLAWDSALAGPLLVRMLRHTAWGDIDFLLVDLPPGTADVQQRVIAGGDLSGAVVVVTPQDVAHLDAKKVVEMFRRAQVDVLGAVENMRGLACPHCGEYIELFPNVQAARSVWAMGVERLHSIPLDPALAAAADVGTLASAGLDALAIRLRQGEL
jgi:ATP-binding protein involved in chromosome partitioning